MTNSLHATAITTFAGLPAPDGRRRPSAVSSGPRRGPSRYTILSTAATTGNEPLPAPPATDTAHRHQPGQRAISS